MIPQLAELLSNSIAQTLEDRVAISFSGGVDSTLIAAIAKKEAKPELFSCGTEGSDDIEFAERASAKMKLPLNKTIVTENCILETYKKCYEIVPNDLLKVELLVPVYKTAEAASKAGHEVLLFGAGAEELFVGYERYYTYLSEGKDLEEILKKEFFNLKDREVCWIKKICRHFGLEARFPYYNKKLEQAVRNISLDVLMEDRERKKIVLREAAKMMGVPSFVVSRKKRAMQYGSGIHKVIMKNADMLNAATLPQPLSPSI
jgi:asparagine synthase (glutamine-hydrolysing)